MKVEVAPFSPADRIGKRTIWRKLDIADTREEVESWA